MTCLSRVLFWSMIFFLLSESIFLASTFPSFLQSLINILKLSAQNLSSFAFFPILWADFTNIPRALADNIRFKRTQHTICKVTLHEFHCRLTTLNSSKHRTWMRRFCKLVCTIRKSYGAGVQLFNNKVLRSRSLRERPAKFPMSIILCMLGGFAETSSLPVAQDAYGCSSTGGQVGLLFWHRLIKTFRGCLPWSVSYEDERLFNFTPNLSDFTQHFSLTKEQRATFFNIRFLQYSLI